MRTTGLPSALAGGDRLILRPKDAEHIYSHPAGEFARLADRGLLLPVARGYYAVVPEGHRRAQWRPTIEEVALGIALADYGRESAALMGISAARFLGAVPRSLALAVVAVDRQRPVRATSVGDVVFVKRSIDRLDASLGRVGGSRGFVTTTTQTALDLADRPEEWGISASLASEALATLIGGLDWDMARELARRQRKAPAWERLRWLGSTADGAVPGARSRRVVSTVGLRHPEALDPEPFGLRP